MEFRVATGADIPDIVGLLRMSLGEDRLPKSEAYWNWKHVSNPFGESPVLLALEGNKLVGVRAFMRWRWKAGSRTFEAVRAVDTATHPEFQGKGIFKKLTLSLLDQCKEAGWDFVFNTPNASSKPGYLKMGWEEAGKLPVTIQLSRPLAMAAHLLTRREAHTDDTQDVRMDAVLCHPGLPDLLVNSRERAKGSIVTDHTVASLRWRYQQVTVAKYHAFPIESGSRLQALFFYRIKPSKYGNEFRITDVFSDSVPASQLRKAIHTEMKKRGAHYISLSAYTDASLPGILQLRNLNIGPMVTIRDIHESPTTALKAFKGWSPSLGDLELF